MKKSLTIIPIILIALFTISNLAFKVGYATEKNTGITTAPYDLMIDVNTPATCAKCHQGTNVHQASLELYLTAENGKRIIGYNPGDTYTVHVKINHEAGSPNAYGFQLLGLVDHNNIGLSGFSNLSSNVKAVHNIMDRIYFEHDGPSTSNEFTVDWQAPTEGRGSVTFYSTGIASNHNNANSGDSAVDSKKTITEGLEYEVVANSTDVLVDSGIRIKQNPVQDEIILMVNPMESFSAEVSLYALSGKMMANQKQNFSQANNTLRIPADQLNSGVYILSVVAEEAIWTEKIMVVN